MNNYDTIKKSPAFKASDIIIIAAATLLLICAVFLIKPRGEGVSAHIYNGNTLIKIMPLNHDDVFTYEYNGHYNIIEVKGGKVSVTDADCSDRYCLNSAPISVSGGSIICLPHNLFIIIEGGTDEVDDYVFLNGARHEK